MSFSDSMIAPPGRPSLPVARAAAALRRGAPLQRLRAVGRQRARPRGRLRQRQHVSEQGAGRARRQRRRRQQGLHREVIRNLKTIAPAL